VIVDKLESGDIALEESVKLFEEGMRIKKNILHNKKMYFTVGEPVRFVLEGMVSKPSLVAARVLEKRWLLR
jgi:hypothetical protein